MWSPRYIPKNKPTSPQLSPSSPEYDLGSPVGIAIETWMNLPLIPHASGPSPIREIPPYHPGSSPVYEFCGEIAPFDFNAGNTMHPIRMNEKRQPLSPEYDPESPIFFRSSPKNEPTSPQLTPEYDHETPLFFRSSPKNEPTSPQLTPEYDHETPLFFRSSPKNEPTSPQLTPEYDLGSPMGIAVETWMNLPLIPHASGPSPIREIPPFDFNAGNTMHPNRMYEKSQQWSPGSSPDYGFCGPRKLTPPPRSSTNSRLELYSESDPTDFSQNNQNGLPQEDEWEYYADLNRDDGLISSRSPSRTPHQIDAMDQQLVEQPHVEFLFKEEDQRFLQNVPNAVEDDKEYRKESRNEVRHKKNYHKRRNFERRESRSRSPRRNSHVSRRHYEKPWRRENTENSSYVSRNSRKHQNQNRQDFVNRNKNYNQRRQIQRRESRSRSRERSPRRHSEASRKNYKKQWKRETAQSSSDFARNARNNRNQSSRGFSHSNNDRREWNRNERRSPRRRRDYD